MKNEHSNDKRKIFWLTPDYFFDTDVSVVPSLRDYFEIEWIIINTLNSNRKTDCLIRGDINREEFNLKYKQRDPRIIFQYIGLIKRIRKSNPDVIYLSFSGLPYFLFLFFMFFNPEKVIYALHNVSTPKGAANEIITRLFHVIYYSKVRRFQVFSKYQLKEIKKKMPDKRHYYAPLALKDFGAPGVTAPVDKIRFLYFGYILEYKRLDLLIKSFQEIYESGIKNIELVIAGQCDNWPHYESMITHGEAIKKRIELVPNKDIPDLVSSCHYVVLPYQDGTQSGVLPLAYRYNKPVIVSDIEAFNQFIINGYTGFVFRNRSQESLTEIMKKVISSHEDIYPVLNRNIEVYKKDEYSIDRIIDRYRGFLDECLLEQEATND